LEQNQSLLYILSNKGIDTVTAIINSAQISLVPADSYQQRLIEFLIDRKYKKNKPVLYSSLSVEEKPKPKHEIIKFSKNRLTIANFLQKDLTIVIEKADLLDQDVEVIVNPANVGLKLGGEFIWLLKLEKWTRY
jgi:hypothetical protein